MTGSAFREMFDVRALPKLAIAPLSRNRFLLEYVLSLLCVYNNQPDFIKIHTIYVTQHFPHS